MNTFQRLKDSVLQDMPFLFVYFYSTFAEDYLTHLWQLFDQLSEHGLIISSSITFLGHNVNPQGAVPLPPQVEGGAPVISVSCWTAGSSQLSLTKSC